MPVCETAFALSKEFESEIAEQKISGSVVFPETVKTGVWRRGFAPEIRKGFCQTSHQSSHRFCGQGCNRKSDYFRKTDVMKTDFRETGLDKVKIQVSELAGWILITSKDSSVETLIETGRRMQRLFPKVREKNIAIHPMTQILEEPATRETFNQSIGISESIQFILRTGYLKSYPPPVSLRRPVEWFLRK